ncbi:zinc transporter ZIP9 [Trichonephila clavata]|uniref:Zinc transporter ZIP9 n=2 Tax=Trichonephila TaxID=2585208 RepID=A0A8X6H4D5_TRICU|nr:zinc transporter ZIP9 [Trichonephila clavata]GFY45871.1 zinc transporter ZIP9 [Trichonephila inaurata madagascariensis]
MSEILVLLFFSSAMLIGCYMAGMIPLIVSMSEDKLQIVSVLGAGLLVGTALSVIIPEGVNTLYSTQLKQIEILRHMHKESISTQETLVSPPDAHGAMDFEPHSVIGLALVLGFIFMLLIDQISSSHSRHPVSDLESSLKQDRQKITATIGLVVHAAADGIALGAAVTTSHTDIEMIVFTAIMLHKAPAAFGLVTFLMHEGLDRVKIRKHLLIFALAAPVLAIVTYFGISQSTKEKLTSMNATGIAMLFSAGTFLYVATVHVLPEIAVQSHRHLPLGDNSPDSKGFRKVELLALVVGALLPLLLSIGHHH